MPLDLKSAYTAETQRAAWDKVMSQLVQDPEVQAILAKKMRDLNLRLPRA